MTNQTQATLSKMRDTQEATAVLEEFLDSKLNQGDALALLGRCGRAVVDRLKLVDRALLETAMTLKPTPRVVRMVEHCLVAHAEITKETLRAAQEKPHEDLADSFYILVEIAEAEPVPDGFFSSGGHDGGEPQYLAADKVSAFRDVLGIEDTRIIYMDCGRVVYTHLTILELFKALAEA